MNIALIGTFDYKNYGDLLFPEVFIHEINKEIPNANLFLFSPIGGKKPFTTNQTVYRISDLESFNRESKIDAIVIGGGDVIRYDESVVHSDKYNDNLQVANLWAFPIFWGKCHDIPVIFNAPGVPFEFDSSVKTLSSALLESVDYISVRDRLSKEYLHQINKSLHIEAVPDTISILDEVITKEESDLVFQKLTKKYGLPDRFFLFQLNSFENGRSHEEYIDTILRIQQWLNCEPILFPIGYVHNDRDILLSLNDNANGSFRIILDELTPKEMYSIISHSVLFVGTSLHGCITSMINQIPAIAINHAGLRKIDGSMETFSMKDNVVSSINHINPDMLNRFPSGKILTSIKNAVHTHFKAITTYLFQKPINQLDYYSIYSSSALKIFNSISTERKINFTVYYDSGNGFSENETFSSATSLEDGKFCIDICPIPINLKAVRFDPCSFPAAIKIFSITNGDGSLPFYPINSITGTDGSDLFYHDDPSYLIDVCKNLSCLHVSGECKPLSAIELYSYYNKLIQEMKNTITACFRQTAIQRKSIIHQAELLSDIRLNDFTNDSISND